MSESTGGTESASSPWGKGRPRSDTTAIRVALQRVTSTLLLATAGIVVAALVEPLFIWRTTPPAFAARSGLGDEIRALGWSTPSATAQNGEWRSRSPSSGRDHDDSIPHATLALLERLGFIADDDTERLETVVTKRSVALLDRAEIDGREIMRVDEGTKLSLVRLVGDWGLVMATRPSGVLYGWVRRSSIGNP